MSVEGEKFLREWETIMRRIESIDARLWEGAGILLVISLAAISLLGWTSPITWDKMIFAIIAGLFSIFILLVWWFIFHRWIHLQRIYSYRAREIEDELDLRVNRYARILEYWESEEAVDVGKEKLKSIDPEAFKRLGYFYEYQQKKYFGKLTIQWCLRCLTILLVLAWFLFMLFHVISYHSS